MSQPAHKRKNLKTQKKAKARKAHNASKASYEKAKEDARKVRSRTEVIDRVKALAARHNKSGTIMSLNPVVLLAGFINDTGLIQFVNERIGKTKKHKVNRGEALAGYLLCFGNGQYKSIEGTQEQLRQIPVGELLKLDPSITVADFNRDVITDVLDALFEYGCEKLFREFAAHAIRKELGDKFNPISVVLDTTTVTFYHKITDKNDDSEQGELKVIPTDETAPKQAAAVRRGNAKNKRFDLGQVVLIALTDSQFGLPLEFAVTDGDASDKTTFAKVLLELIPSIVETFKSVRYVTADSAMCTKASFDALRKRGLHGLTRMPDGYTQASELIKNRGQLGEKLQPIDYRDGDGDAYHGYLTDGTLYGARVKLLLVDNRNLAKSKRATIMRRAKKEQEELRKKLKEKYRCAADAMDRTLQLMAKAKYCTITPLLDEEAGDGSWQFDCKSCYKTRGRPSRDAVKEIKWIMAKCTVELDESKIDEAVERERCYVLVCTDTSADLTMADILKLYKGNQMVESLWSLYKNRRISINSVYLHRLDRIEALLTVTAMALLANKVIEALVRQAVKDGLIVIPDQRGKFAEANPTTYRITNYMNRHQIVLFEDAQTGAISFQGLNEVNMSLLVALGPEWQRLIEPDTYSSLSYWAPLTQVEMAA